MYKRVERVNNIQECASPCFFLSRVAKATGSNFDLCVSLCVCPALVGAACFVDASSHYDSVVKVCRSTIPAQLSSAQQCCLFCLSFLRSFILLSVD